MTTAQPITQPTLNVSPRDITSGAFKANPFPFYAELRANAPVYPITMRRRGRGWLVTRYDDVMAALKDERLVKDRRNAMTAEQLNKAPKTPSFFRALSENSLLSLDDPAHGRLRGLVHKAFTPRIIEQMTDQIQTYTDQLLDRAAAKRQFDLVADFATPLPLKMIGQILGVPEQDNDKFHRWTKTFVSAGSNSNLFVLVPTMLRFMHYLRGLINERTRRPKDDLISAFAQVKEGTDQMNADEVLSMVFLLLSAGHETTLNLIGSGTLALLENPAQFARLRDEPNIGRSAIEELVRYVCPVEMATDRYTREAVTIAGTTIPRGEMVLAVVGSANRDPAYFDNPDTLDLGRTNNKHLSFGQGVHYCVGAPLARLEGQIALTTLAKRMPGLHLTIPTDTIAWRSSFTVRGLESLPVSI